MRVKILATAFFAFALPISAFSMTLESATVKPEATMDLGQVFNGFGCTGKNVSPELHWSGAPAETKAYAVTMYDPDAPTGSGWGHWVVFNIPANVAKLDLGA